MGDRGCTVLLHSKYNANPTHQSEKRLDCAQALGWYDARLHMEWQGGDRNEGYNPPGRWPWIAHNTGKPGLDTVAWGFRPEGSDLPPVKEVGIEKGSTGRYLRHMWQQGRVIVPVDGWMEGDRYVCLKSGIALLAAITNWRQYRKSPDGAGFILIVSGAGLADPSMRRPIALTAADANRWMDHSTSMGEVMRIAGRGMPSDAFEW